MSEALGIESIDLHGSIVINGRRVRIDITTEDEPPRDEAAGDLEDVKDAELVDEPADDEAVDEDVEDLDDDLEDDELAEDDLDEDELAEDELEDDLDDDDLAEDEDEPADEATDGGSGASEKPRRRLGRRRKAGSSS